MLISLTVGKVDAGVAVLLTQDKRLIEFPSILLPPNISSGSIVDITVSRNFASEQKSQSAFLALQDAIYTSFGESEPLAPVLRCKNATQTSVVLEWDPIELATADCISLSLFRNGQKAGNIPRPTSMRTTKISGLAVDTEYTFHLVLRTSAGTYSSEKVVVKTHKMTDLSGITVTPGILPAQLRDSLTKAVERIGAKMADTVRIDTTHFVTTEGRGIAWEKAVEMNIPVSGLRAVREAAGSWALEGITLMLIHANARSQRFSRARRLSGPRNLHCQAQTLIPMVRMDTKPCPLHPPAKDTPKKADEEESSEEEDDEEEENKSTVQDEQKVRVEDRDQHKVALRPAEPASEAGEKEKEKEAAEEGGSGADTPGQSSFQDVAL
ncbi:Cell fusion protein cfr1 [Lachnellula suecica]|uniref:Cell fusion protein cfr1 n=1 Tax=Lachnellula suecica TaxID=602035 RepID=A0A8T9BXZ1_9HELO|nr:Cell fusion protein cfr1 [Lachnellula suecica]